MLLVHVAQKVKILQGVVAVDIRGGTAMTTQQEGGGGGEEEEGGWGVRMRAANPDNP